MLARYGLVVAAGLAAAALAGPARADWAPPKDNDAQVIHVREGCGIRWHRNDLGACVPNEGNYERHNGGWSPYRYDGPPAVRYVPPPPPRYYYPPAGLYFDLRG